VDDIRTVGRIGGKALAWFIFASVISLTLGLMVVGYFEPGRTMQLPIPEGEGASGIAGEGLSLQALLTHAMPTGILDAMARNEILQIVVYSLFFGIAMAALGERTRPIVAALDTLSYNMLKVTGYVMFFAPLAVFGALASIVAKEGLGIVRVYGLMVGEFYLGIAILWLVLIALGAAAVAPACCGLCGESASQCSSHSQPRVRRLPIRRRSKSSGASASATGS